MTEAEWLACTNPWEMLEFLERRANPRKPQLFAVACCRRAWPLSTDPRHREAVEAAERYADGALSAAEFAEALQPVVELWARSEEREWGPFRYMTAATRHLEGRGSAKYAARFAAKGLAYLQGEKESPPWWAARQAEEAFQCSLLCDIFGDPSRPFRLDPAWLSGEGRSAVELARKIDEEGRFGDLPLLADALVRAGCRDRAVLDHCRAPGPHVRGCWVLDALLGRETAVVRGLITDDDWRGCEDPASLLHFLSDKGTERQWRLFAVACCKRIDRFMADDRSRRAVEVAERYAEGAATVEALEEARSAAQDAQAEAKRVEWETEAQEDFCITPRYAAVSRSLFAALAARSAVCRDPRKSDAAPGTREAEYWAPSNDWAVAVARWNVYSTLADENVGSGPDTVDSFVDSALMTEHGKISSGRPSPSVEEAAERARRAELRAHCEILHDLFGEFLGPPGDEGAWLPCGGAAPVSEWWCQLPTTRRLILRPEWMEWSAAPFRSWHVRSMTRKGSTACTSSQTPWWRTAARSRRSWIICAAGPHLRGCWVLEFLMGSAPSRTG